MQLPVAYFREGADGNLAAPAEAIQERTFTSGGSAGGGIVQELEMAAGRGVAFANFDAERSLASGWTHDFSGNNLLDQLRFAQALESGRGQNDSVVFALFELSQARVDVAAQGMNIEIGADGLELSLPAQAGRAYARALGQLLETRIIPRAEGITRILTFRDGGDFKSRRKFGRQVFQRVHGEINAASGQGFFSLLREHALGANHCQANVGNSG